MGEMELEGNGGKVGEFLMQCSERKRVRRGKIVRTGMDCRLKIRQSFDEELFLGCPRHHDCLRMPSNRVGYPFALCLNDPTAVTAIVLAR